MAVTTAVARVRKNGANANGFIGFPDMNTGQVEDTTHSDAFVATDDFNFAIIIGGSSGNMTATHVGVMILNADVDSLIKTFNGLARASVKTVNGLALASVKTWNGLA